MQAQGTAMRRQLISQLKDERSKLQDLAWELDDTERLLADISDGIVTAANHDTLALQRERLEDAVIQQMMYIDRLEQLLDEHDHPAIHAA